jgi:hypothetical protein
MKNIFIVTEGQAEEMFYKSVFVDYFRSTCYFQVTCMPNKRNAYSRDRKGGTVTFDVCVKNIRRFLNGATHCEKVFLIYDFYGLHASFYEGYMGKANDVSAKIDFLVNRLEGEIKDPKFKFFLQVHEFEAFLFSDPAAIVRHYNAEDKLPAFLKILSTFNNHPELINDSVATAPSKRIIDIFPQYAFGKTSDGVVIAKNIGIETIRSKCLRFETFCKML